MGIRYYKLFDLLNRRNMKKSELRKVISSATVAKLSKGEYISGEAIDKICQFLNCQPGDIMEVVKWEGEASDGSKAYEADYITATVPLNENEMDDVIETITKFRKPEE